MTVEKKTEKTLKQYYVVNLRNYEWSNSQRILQSPLFRRLLCNTEIKLLQVPISFAFPQNLSSLTYFREFPWILVGYGQKSLFFTKRLALGRIYTVGTQNVSDKAIRDIKTVKSLCIQTN